VQGRSDKHPEDEMSYRIEGVSPKSFAALADLGDAELAERGIVRVAADGGSGFPCRVSLDHPDAGEPVLLLNHVSNDVPTPYRTAYAIYVRERAAEAAVFEGRLPPVLQDRMLSLRAFDAAGMLRHGLLAQPSEVEERIEALHGDPAVASIHAHTPAFGCFLARIERN
jgi:hypothetical protein